VHKVPTSSQWLVYSEVPQMQQGNDTLPVTAGSLATQMLQIIKGTVRKLPKEMVVSNEELQDISREIAQS
nr:hypothetical protein [Tanacetum cinerariifolium]